MTASGTRRVDKDRPLGWRHAIDGAHRIWPSSRTFTRSKAAEAGLIWCGRRDSNPDDLGPTDFKSDCAFIIYLILLYKNT